MNRKVELGWVIFLLQLFSAFVSVDTAVSVTLFPQRLKEQVGFGTALAGSQPF